MSSDLDSSLFPILMKVTENNKPLLVLTFLGKARTWIDDIIRSVNDMVKRYEQHSHSVAMCITDVCQEQNETENLLIQHSEEIKCLQEAMANLEKELREQNGNWTIQVKLTDLQLQLANSKIQLGAKPSPVHLNDVRQCLCQIQKILIQLQKFWESVSILLDTLKGKTFVMEDLIEDLVDLKDEFLHSINTAGESWKRFGGCCQSAQGVFSVQSKDAYKFLEINPSSLSEDERKEQYESVKKKLSQISPQF